MIHTVSVISSDVYLVSSKPSEVGSISSVSESLISQPHSSEMSQTFNSSNSGQSTSSLSSPNSHTLGKFFEAFLRKNSQNFQMSFMFLCVKTLHMTENSAMGLVISFSFIDKVKGYSNSNVIFDEEFMPFDISFSFHVILFFKAVRSSNEFSSAPFLSSVLSSVASNGC